MSKNGQFKTEEAAKNDVIKSIKATRKHPDGIYIRGTAQGYPLLFTTDTGASKTIISSRVYESFKPEDRPKLVKSSKLVGAGGVSIKVLGKGTFTLQLGPVSMQTEAIVAEIDEDGLLGVDVLQNGKGGPTDLLLSKGVLKVEGKEVPIIQVGMKNRVRKVTSADHFFIPAQSEAVIDVYVERQEYDDFSSRKEYLVSPSEHFPAENPLHMSSTLIDINRACTSKVRVINPYPISMSITQDAVIGQAEPIECNSVVVTNKEDSSETENHVAVRRIKLAPKENTRSIPEYTARRYMSISPRKNMKPDAAKLAFYRYKVGDMVRCLIEVRRVGVSPNLEFIYEGSFLVTGKFSELDFVLQVDKDEAERPIHHDNLKPCAGGHIPSWVTKARRKVAGHKGGTQ